MPEPQISELLKVRLNEQQELYMNKEISFSTFIIACNVLLFRYQKIKDGSIVINNPERYFRANPMPTELAWATAEFYKVFELRGITND